MSGLRAAFNYVLSLNSIPATIVSPGSATTYNIRIAPSNYFRNIEVANDISSKGREFVIPKTDLVKAGYPVPKKGDRITTTALGLLIISESPREMFLLGGEIAGYRVRIG